MRAWCRHTKTKFLTTQQSPEVNGDHPTMRVGFRFCRSDGQIGALKEWWGLLDSGSGITAVPAFWIGLFGNQYPAHLTGPISVRLTGLHATRVVPGYFAILSVSNQLLYGPFCSSCGEKLIGRRCPVCLRTPEVGAFLIAAVPDLAFPIIGRDVAENFLNVINPLARVDGEKFSMLANGWDGRALAQGAKVLRGTSLSP